MTSPKSLSKRLGKNEPTSFYSYKYITRLKEGYFGNVETNGVHLRILRILHVPRD